MRICIVVRQRKIGEFMNIEGQSVTWREAVTTKSSGRIVLLGERVVTGTIKRERKSRGGTTDYHIDVQSVVGFEPDEVRASIWVKRNKLTRGMSWQRAKTKPRTAPRCPK